MSEKCPHCGAVVTNPNLPFCTACGKPLPAVRTHADTPAMETAESVEPVAEVKPSEPEKTQPLKTQPVKSPAKDAPRPTPKQTQVKRSLQPDGEPPRRKRGCMGCLKLGVIVTLVLLIALVVAYPFLIRPRLETYILGEIRKSIESVEPGPAFASDTEYVAFTEDEVNDSLVIPAELESYVTDAHMELEQDRVVIDFTAMGLSSQLSGEVSADANGGLYIHDVDTGWLIGLVLSGDALARELSDSINRSLLEPTDIRILAVQITDGQIGFTLEGEGR